MNAGARRRMWPVPRVWRGQRGQRVQRAPNSARRAACRVVFLAVFLAVFLSACTGSIVPHPATPTPTQAASPTPFVAPTPTPLPTPVPTLAPVTYRVRVGDTLGRIATHFKRTIGQLLTANLDITDPNHIEIGQLIAREQPIGIIEAMKIFSEIPAEHGGIVVALPAQDGQLVQSGTPLVILKKQA